MRKQSLQDILLSVSQQTPDGLPIVLWDVSVVPRSLGIATARARDSMHLLLV